MLRLHPSALDTASWSHKGCQSWQQLLNYESRSSFIERSFSEATMHINAARSAPMPECPEWSGPNTMGGTAVN